MPARRAVFLDRDGVLNASVIRAGKPYPPARAEEVAILPGVAQALRKLKAAGYMLIVVTNQPDVARGTAAREDVEAINARLAAELPLDEFRTCFHDGPDGCACRKPRPGMLLDAAKEHGLDLSACLMVGDRWRDIEAGQNAGCATVFIDYGYDEKRPERYDLRAGSLAEAADVLLSGGMPPQPLPSRGQLMKTIDQLNVKIFADGADKAGMLEMYAKPFVKGLTTNPTLMRKAGISDYKAFALDILQAIPDRSISLEVFSDELAEMERQALEIASWGENVYVKVPVSNTKREYTYDVVRRLSAKGVKVNVTALMTLTQVRHVVEALDPKTPSYISVFAGRVADTGVDPVPVMAAAVELMKANPLSELIWASPRELLNIFQADAVGCHIITVTNSILKKLALVGYDLDEYSLDTVKMFYNDATAAGYKI